LSNVAAWRKATGGKTARAKGGRRCVAALCHFDGSIAGGSSRTTLGEKHKRKRLLILQAAKRLSAHPAARRCISGRYGALTLTSSTLRPTSLSNALALSVVLASKALATRSMRTLCRLTNMRVIARNLASFVSH
jgi:hypothetical protein